MQLLWFRHTIKREDTKKVLFGYHLYERSSLDLWEPHQCKTLMHEHMFLLTNRLVNPIYFHLKEKSTSRPGFGPRSPALRADALPTSPPRLG